MPAPIGNEYWKLRKTDGRPKKFRPDELEEKANEYFQWCIDNPLYEAVLHGKSGEIMKLPRLRAFTETGLCVFLGISTTSFYSYYVGEESQDYVEVITRIREVIRTQKFEGAAAGFLNANIIARDLGLRDKQDVDHTSGGEPFNVTVNID